MRIDEVMDAATTYRQASTFSGRCIAKAELRTAIEQHVAEAVKAEREACAQTCEAAELLDRQNREDMAYCEAVSHCADLIRARGTP